MTLVWWERNRLIDTLLDIHNETEIERLIHGECPDGGVDLIADLWARTMGIPSDPTPTDEALDGPWPGAGPRRNGRMVAKLPDMVLAAPGGRGTANAVWQARKAGIEVREIPPK